MLESCPIILLVPLMLFSIGFLLVMWPGVLLVYRGTESLEIRRERAEKAEKAAALGLILGGFLWLQLFLSGWAFFTATHPCAELGAESSPELFCYIIRFFYSLIPIAILYAVTDFKALLVVMHILATGLTYLVSVIVVGVGGKFYAFIR